MNKNTHILFKNSFSNSLENAERISISFKKNHDDIERVFIEELEEVKYDKGNVFSTALNNNVYAYFELIACLEDQLERRGINYTFGGGDNYSSRFRYSANVKEISDFLASCTTYINISCCCINLS